MKQLLTPLRGSILLFLFFIAFTPSLKADHTWGSEITYTCTATPGIWKITLTFYRDCSGIANCGNLCGSSCTKQLNVSGCLNAILQVSLVSVSDVGYNSLCPGSKSICNNMMCTTPGTFTPGVERYVYEGNLNLGPSSGIPTACCFVRLSINECCRPAITAGGGGQNYYTECTIDRCASMTPCNGSPVFTSDPPPFICGGQPLIYANGAIDPDRDSLSYSFTPSLAGGANPITYLAPYTYDKPLPYYAPASGPWPLGILCDPLTGDVMFTPAYLASGTFSGMVAVMVKQWKRIGGVPVLLGTVTRDFEVVIGQCTPNNTPKILTNPANQTQPILNYSIFAGQTLCFDVIAKDTDVYPAATPPRSDTTYLSWNAALAYKGATFVPKYNPSLRTTTGPREDRWEFCWTPDTSCISSLPWQFNVLGKDNACPVVGRMNRTFGITVMAPLNVSISQGMLGCYQTRMSYVQNGVPANITSSKWSISKVANDYSLASKDSFTNVSTTPYVSFSQGGKYLVKLELSAGSGSPQFFYDTIRIDVPITVNVTDTAVCEGKALTVTYGATGGFPPYSYRWFVSPDTTVALNFNTSATAYTFTPAANKRYTLQVRDTKGCRSYDSTGKVKANALPVSTLPASARICASAAFTLDAGNNGGKAVKYLWSTGDTLRTVSAKDSGSYMVTLTDANNCVQKDTLMLYINQPLHANAGKDTSYCGTKPIPLSGSGGSLYQWKNLSTDSVIAAKSVNAGITVTPSSATQYELTAFATQSELECSARDTVTATVNALPVSLLLSSMRICAGTSYTLDPGNNGGKPVTYLWSTGDTTRTITRNDSNSFTVTMSASAGCQAVSTLRLYVNTPVPASAGTDVHICTSQNITLQASGGQSYGWKKVGNNTTIAPKSSNPNASVMITANAAFEATVFATQSGVECSNRDTMLVLLSAQLPAPVISGPSTVVSGQPNAYSVTNAAGNSFNWMAVSGTITGNGTHSVSVVFAGNGTSALKVVESGPGCVSDTGQKSITVSGTSGLKENPAFENLLVYPNPTSTVVNIRMETAAKSVALDVVDVQGKCVLKSTAKHDGGLFQKTLDLSPLPHGIYFVKISAGGTSSVVKVRVH